MELNIVTCGNCGKVFGHEIEHEDELTCPYCSMRDDISVFPDLFHSPDHIDSIIEVEKAKAITDALHI